MLSPADASPVPSRTRAGPVWVGPASPYAILRYRAALRDAAVANMWIGACQCEKGVKLHVVWVRANPSLGRRTLHQELIMSTRISILALATLATVSSTFAGVPRGNIWHPDGNAGHPGGRSAMLSPNQNWQAAMDTDRYRVWPAAEVVVDDNEIRAAFVGREALPPQPWPVNFGPYEFHSDGTFFRQQDLASASGHYVIANGRICIERSERAPATECYRVFREGAQYFLQHDSGGAAPFPITLRPIAGTAK
jgi:hypothetical protein